MNAPASTVQLNVRVPAVTRDLVKSAAARRGMKHNEFVVRAIERELDDEVAASREEIAALLRSVYNDFCSSPQPGVS